jgi:transposase
MQPVSCAGCQALQRRLDDLQAENERLRRQLGEAAIRFGVILRKVWGGNRTWAGARAQSVLMSVWRTCWQQGRSAVDFLSQLLRGPPPPGCATPGLDLCPADAAVALPSRDRQRY